MNFKLAVIFKSVFIFFAVPLTFAFYEGYTELTYTDVDQFNEFYPAISYFTNASVVSGYEDGHFGSKENVNRAEALKIILSASGVEISQNLPASSDSQYVDIDLEAWYAPFVLKATDLGIVEGYSDNKFYPENEVNLAESLKMIFYANNLRDFVALEKDPANDVPKDAWYSYEAAYAIENDIVWPNLANNIEPSKFLARGELLELLYKFLLRDNRNKIVYRGIATYYGDVLEGNNTSSGEAYDPNKFTAAHRFLDFGTKIKVVNLENGQTVEVVVNDRGPYSDKYELDLSRVAFELLSPLSRGIIDVYYYIVE